MKLLGIIFVAFCATLLAACGGSGTNGAGQGNAVATGETIGVKMSEFTLAIDQQSVPAGNITFHITNSGAEKHELVILRTDLALDAIPQSTEDPKKISEGSSGVTHVDEIDGVDAGQTKDLTVTLSAGRYLLVCNYPGHAHAGMTAILTVQS